MAKQILNQTYGTSVVDKNGRPTTEFFTLLESLVGLEIIDGKGTPEGQVKARFKSLYIDIDTSVLYIKTTKESEINGWVNV